MILKHNFSAKEMTELKKERINQKIKIKEAREWAAFLKDEDDRYVDIRAACQPAIDKLNRRKKMEINTAMNKLVDYFLNLCIGISISLLGLAAYVSWF